ncbi:hypothetical protein [Amphritea sp.]|uniref:hypothetical protein n=1 Tax=Amphritea sp. TaxID=1872502 RepID=UPI0025C0ED99|nr:hypothetical protein [Amphritea sp.]
MTEYSPAATRWLQGFAETERLQQEIFAYIKADSGIEAPEDTDTENETPLAALIQQQDTLIRKLPFEQLSADDVEQLKGQIARLQSNHQTLVEAISTRRQSLLNLSSQTKKAKRSIKAYQQAQDL